LTLTVVVVVVVRRVIVGGLATVELIVVSVDSGPNVQALSSVHVVHHVCVGEVGLDEEEENEE
jgi:hypothetical protein